MNAARIAVACVRTAQVALALVAAVFVLGALQMNVITFAAIGVFALVLLAFAGLLELVVNAIRGRAGGVDG
jgi:hypothetical protein